ncbi:BRO-N domain-containing protein [Lonepinella sp. BR2904]|uniref:BRO-N domain-containing protein n=1 Tax=Lonepinella sp. BR2904 TaxID=3434551 RepID=UPI003F6E1A85
MTTLTFQNKALSVINQQNQIWLTLTEIAKALGYSNDTGIRKIYDRHQDEFRPNMTALIDMPTAGGIQKVRIFSLRGCHLIGMFSHTKAAKEFRHWALDVLDKEIERQNEQQTAVKIAPLSKQHQQNIKELVMGRAKSLPKDQQARATITQWAALKTHFGKSYKDINDDQYLEAVSLLARLPLDGELLLDQPQAPQTGIVLTPDELALLLRLWSSSTNLHESGHHLLRRLNGLLVGREVDSLQFNVRLHTELLKAIHPLIERLMLKGQITPKLQLLEHKKH